MRPPRAHRVEDDFWDPGDAPRFTLGEVIRQTPRAALVVLVAIATIALAFFMFGVPVDELPGWWQ